jgi:hypothetical protein
MPPPPRCGQIVVGTGSVKAVGTTCDIQNVKFEKSLLAQAKKAAAAAAKKVCPKKCPVLQLRDSGYYKRECANGKITVTFRGKYICGQ